MNCIRRLIQGSTFLLASVAVGDPYAARSSPPNNVQIVIDGVPAQQLSGNGKTYIQAFPGKEYSVEVSNPYGRRLAVAVAVDGLNSIDGQHTAAASAKKWIIEPYGKVVVRGWQVSQDRLRQFVFTTESQSYGAKLGKTQDLGNISVVGFLERAPRPPADLVSPRSKASGRAPDMPSAAESESPSSAFGASPGELAATGQGRSVDHSVRTIAIELETSPAMSSSIRYEYREALEQLGILPRPSTLSDMKRRENGQGFAPVKYAPEF